MVKPLPFWSELTQPILLCADIGLVRSVLWQGNVAAFALTLPLDTARVRMILDDKMKSKGSTEIIAEIVSDEGV